MSAYWVDRLCSLVADEHIYDIYFYSKNAISRIFMSTNKIFLNTTLVLT